MAQTGEKNGDALNNVKKQNVHHYINYQKKKGGGRESVSASE